MSHLCKSSALHSIPPAGTPSLTSLFQTVTTEAGTDSTEPPSWDGGDDGDDSGDDSGAASVDPATTSDPVCYTGDDTGILRLFMVSEPTDLQAACMDTNPDFTWGTGSLTFELNQMYVMNHFEPADDAPEGCAGLYQSTTWDDDLETLCMTPKKAIWDACKFDSLL
jgi:hypothetical protein